MINIWQYNFITKKTILINESDTRTLDQIAITLPAGIYTTIRSFGKKYVLHLHHHLQRFDEGFKLNNSHFNFEINELRSSLCRILDSSQLDLKIRLHIPFETPEICFIMTESLLAYPESAYHEGVKVKTNRINRENPKAKQTKFIKQSILEKEMIQELGLEESIMVSEGGELLEGLTSNFYGIKDGVLFTEDDRVLPGITRKTVLEEAAEAGIEISFDAINLSHLTELDEAFITSTNRKIMPVIQIDDTIIGNGKPGPITKKLMRVYSERIKRDTEPITLHHPEK